MATFKCARCNDLRQSATDACDKCGWTPKKASYDDAAKDAGAGIIDEVLATARTKRREKQLAVLGLAGLALLFLANHLSSETLGEHCEDNDDCRSGLCLQMYSSPNICSERCEDSECAEGFLCVGATERTTNRKTFFARESSAKVCVPASAITEPEEPPPDPLPEDQAE